MMLAIFESAVGLENSTISNAAVDITSVFRYANGYGADGFGAEISTDVEKSSVNWSVNSSVVDYP